MNKEFVCKGCGEKVNKYMQSNNIGYCYICNEFYMQKKISDLETKLAEKDVDLSLARNEIDTLKHNLKVAQEHDNVMCEQYFGKCKKINQDKISFAIYNLSLVCGMLTDTIIDFEKKEYDLSMHNYLEQICLKFAEKISQKIKQLKEQIKNEKFYC